MDGEDFPILEEMLTQMNSDSKFALIITGEYQLQLQENISIDLFETMAADISSSSQDAVVH